MQRKLSLGMALVALALATTLQGQDVVKDALATFPHGTIRVEYSNPAHLRTLPNYQSLRQRYIGPRLQSLESSLSKLGVRESDINELLLGWERGKSELELFGLATGRFDSKSIRRSAGEIGLSPTAVSGQDAYCLEAGLAGNCVLVLGESRGLFASLAMLTALMDARGGQAPALASDERFAGLVKEAAHSGAPIWGVAVGDAVTDWFKGWMPSQGSLELDWSRTFGTVQALAYSVQAKDRVDLNVSLECTSAETAASLKQTLEGLKLFQQIAWQNQNPNRPNPFEALEVGLKDSRINLSLTTPFDAVADAGVTP